MRRLSPISRLFMKRSHGGLAHVAVLRSIEARDGAVMRRHVVRKIQHHLVDITPTPSFRRIITLDDRMLCRMKMFGRVMIGRIVAASDMAAGAAYAQVHPDIAGFQAFFAA